ncbi:MAG: hypothetical protein ABIG99_02170 [Patescibacteria group bacterium]
MQIMQAIDPVRGPAHGTIPYVPPLTIIDHIVAGRTELWSFGAPGEVNGRAVWRHLMENREILASCVRTFGLRIVKSMGLDFFRKHFDRKVILGAPFQDYYPCLYEKDGDLELRSQWVEYPLRPNDRFLRVLP